MAEHSAASAAMQRVTELQQRAQELLAADDLDGWERTMRELRLAERERDLAWDRLAASRQAKERTRRLPHVSSREQARAILDRARLPLSPQQIGALHSALYGEEIPYKGLTSLRHDEKRAFDAHPDARSYYICPALQYDTLAPARGLLTLSTWAPADRIVAPLTLRTAHLRLTLTVTELLDEARRTRPEPPVALERLLWRLAATVPGIHPGELDLKRVGTATRAELAVLAERDETERAAAAERAVRMDPGQRLFGATFRDVNASRRRKHA